jgi:hypothetical protein
MAYESNLLTPAQYQAIIGVVTNTDDLALITNYIIPAASLSVERFLSRKLLLNTYIEWTSSPNAFGVFFPLEYPLVSLFSVSRAAPAFSITNNGTVPINIVVQQDQVVIYNTLTNTLTSYLYTAYPTVAALLVKMATDFPGLALVAAVDPSTATVLLRPATISLPVGLQGVVEGGITAMTGHVADDRIVYGSMFTGMWSTADWPNYPQTSEPMGNAGTICLVYSAGYSPLPTDLQFTVACICRDMFRVAKGKQATGMKSESVSQYRYELLDGVSFDSLVSTKYSSALAQYRRIIL